MPPKAEVKELIQDFVLITYDIPAKAKKLRRSFLRDAAAMGAEQYTESVYLLPYSEEALKMACELESAGHAVVWTAHMPDEKTALNINIKYEHGIKNRCMLIEQRLVIAQEYIQNGWLKRAQKMGIKTGKLLKELSVIAENYKPDWFTERLQELVKNWKEVHG